MTAIAKESETPVLSPYASTEFNVSFWHELRYLASDVATVLGNDLVAVVLGGGFGRSEGCVTLVDGHEVPYNDVDLFLITRKASPKNLGKLKHLSERYEHRLKIAVDFSRPQTLAMIAKWQPLLMWQELVKGHLVLLGPEDVLARNVCPSLLDELPSVEASRLLLNRGAGLLWAARVDLGLEPAPDSHFVVRNYFKCAQALADATLIAFGQYCSEPAEKARRVSLLAASQSIVDELSIPAQLHAALEFRRSPHAACVMSRLELRIMAQRWCQLFLQLENRRLHRGFECIADYSTWSGSREPEHGFQIRFLASNLSRGRIGWHHPRELVYRSLSASLNDLTVSPDQFVQSSAAALRQWQEAQ